MHPDLLSPATPPASAKPLPTGPNAGTEWDAICQSMGITPLTPEEAAKLPPWTEEEANAFARAIDEMFERVEEPKWQV